MKRVCTFFVILIALSCWTSVADAQTVRMPDENLAAVVRDALGLARGAPITRQAMQRLTFLRCTELQGKRSYGSGGPDRKHYGIGTGGTTQAIVARWQSNS